MAGSPASYWFGSHIHWRWVYVKILTSFEYIRENSSIPVEIEVLPRRSNVLDSTKTQNQMLPPILTYYLPDYSKVAVVLPTPKDYH